MQQLTMTADRQVEWWDVPAPALAGPRRGAGASAGGRPVRPRPADPARRRAHPGPDRHRPRVRRRGGRGRRRRPQRRAGRPRRRALPDLLWRLRALPPRADRRLHERAAALDVRLRHRSAATGAARCPISFACPSPTRCWWRRRRASPPPCSPARATTSPTAGARSLRTSRRGPGADVLIVGGGGREHRPLRGRRRSRPGRRPRRLRRRRSGPAGRRGRARRRDRGRARRPGPSASSRSPSTPAARTPGCTRRCARPSPAACARASASTTRR